MSAATSSKKRKGASWKRDDDENERMLGSVRVEEDQGETPSKAGTGIVVVPPDNSGLSLIQEYLWVDLWSDDKTIVTQALTKLADLFLESVVLNNNAASLQHMGVAPTIVNAMRKWYTVPRIQGEGCRALQNISSHLAFVVSFSKAANEVGALKAIVWAMTTYSDDKHVQGNACGALGNLCSDVKENADDLVHALKGADAIVSAMKNFPDDVYVQCCASRALDSLSCWKEFKASIVEAGACRFLVDAIEKHKDENDAIVKDLQKNARDTVKRLL